MDRNTKGVIGFSAITIALILIASFFLTGSAAVILPIFITLFAMIIREDYQYKKYNYGYLRFCDTMLMYLLFSISNTNKTERIKACKDLLNKIIDLFNYGLTDMPILLRGLSYYDRSKVIKYAVLLRKYATIAINNEKILNGKIINASPDDLKFILSDELTTTKMDNYTSNRINSTEAIQKNDEEAELVSNFIKLLGMTNV